VSGEERVHGVGVEATGKAHLGEEGERTGRNGRDQSHSGYRPVVSSSRHIRVH
jgi:hypothetical protein